jgi:glycerol-3-phosphate acyltransferase PlsY
MIAIKILYLFLACLGSFLLGSIPFSVILGLLSTGKDLRKYNVGNPGGFNSILTYGPIIGIAVTILDISKGSLSIAIIDHVFSLTYFSASGVNVWHILACILGPVFGILGHNYSPWLKFKGGRGIGVFMGTLLYANPLIFFCFMLVLGILIQFVKLPTRVANVLVGPFFMVPAFFIPISPPWTVILISWTAGSTEFAFLTQGLIAVAMFLAYLPKHMPSFIAALRGADEWTFSLKDGQDISDEYETIKEVDISSKK